ncbi:MAG: PEP-CTERM sorting domain-containing protein [Phycisphaerae bacterium]|nr:PEP-CTERM sorting domain-containing protein [Phycisphaerae bacterium]
MKSVSLCAVALLGTAAASLGATATFDPPLVEVPSGTPALFDVFVAVESLSAFDAADILIGSNEVPDLGFAYSPDWEAAMAGFVTPITYDGGAYGQDVFVGGFRAAGAIQGSVWVGTLTVDTTGLVEGDYPVSVDGATDGMSRLTLAGSWEPLSGAGIVRIPEPTTVGLVAIGVLVWLRRRGR